MTFKIKQKVAVALFNKRITGTVTLVNGSRITVRDEHGVDHIVSASKVSAARAASSPVSAKPVVRPSFPSLLVPAEAATYPPTPQPKNNPMRSERYKAYVRSKPCAACGRTDGVEASHHGKHGIATKPDDHLCIPLCKACHREDWHKHGTLMGWSREETEAFIAQTQRDLLIPWMIERASRPAVNVAIVTALVELERERIAKP